MALNKKVTGVAVAAGVLALGAGVGVASLAQAQPTPSPGSPSSSASPSAGTERPGGGKDGRGARGFFGAQFASQLAEKLGLTEAKVTEALRAIHEERRADRPSEDPGGGSSADPSTRPDRAEREAELVKALAEKLGVDEAKVTAALAEIREAAQTERAAALKERLDAAVQDGTLTQAEADAVTKAVEEGVIGGAFGRR